MVVSAVVCYQCVAEFEPVCKTHLVSSVLTGSGREHGNKLADEGTCEPELTASVEEGGDLSGDTSVPEESQLGPRTVLATHLVGAPMMIPSASLRSSGLMIGYLGFREPPACILPRTSSERVSWLRGQRIERIRLNVAPTRRMACRSLRWPRLP